MKKMKALKEVEVVKKYRRSIEELHGLLYQKDLDYPYTISRIMKSNYFIDAVLNATEENLNSMIDYLNQFCCCLHNNSEVNYFNISNIAMFVIAESDILRKEISDLSIKNDFESNKSLLYLKIKNALEKIDIKRINCDLESNLFVNASKESEKDLELLNHQKLKDIILNLIYEYKFSYGDILTKFFLNIDFDVIMKFRKDFRSKTLKKNKKNFVVLLNALNSMVHESYKLFNIDGNFLYILLEDYLFSSDKLREYFRRELSTTNYEFTLEIYEKKSLSNREYIIDGFIKGLSHIKEYCILEFSKYDNRNLEQFNFLSLEKKNFYIKEISEGLEERSIYTIYKASHYNDKEILKYKVQLEQLVDDISRKKDFILITKQELTDEQKTLIFSIVNKLGDMSDTYQNVCLTNINEVGRNITFLTFNIRLGNKFYFVKLNKNNSELVWHVYDEKDKIIRDKCITIYDLERIILLIQKYEKDQLLRSKYNLL